MGTKVNPPTKVTAPRISIGSILIFLGTLLILWSLYLLYIKVGPTIPLKTVTPPQEVNVPQYTNNNNIIIEGKTEPNSKIVIYENEEKLTESTSDINGYFTIPLELTEGKHELSIKTIKTKLLKFISKDAKVVTVNIDQTKPVLTNIMYPKKLTNNSFELKGVASEDIQLIIQAGNTRILEKEIPKGEFRTKVKLQNLDSKNIYLYAIDKSGNSSNAFKLDITLPTPVFSEQYKKKNHILPNSAGPLDSVLNMASKNILAIYITSLIGLVYLTSFAFVKYLKRD